MQKEIRRKIWMLYHLARRGAWYGVGRFSGAWLWGITHNYCRQCKGPKQYRTISPNCYHCQTTNLFLALSEDDEVSTPNPEQTEE